MFLPFICLSAIPSFAVADHGFIDVMKQEVINAKNELLIGYFGVKIGDSMSVNKKSRGFREIQLLVIEIIRKYTFYHGHITAANPDSILILIGSDDNVIAISPGSNSHLFNQHNFLRVDQM